MKVGSNMIYVFWALVFSFGKRIICMTSSSVYYCNCRILSRSSPTHLGWLKHLLWAAWALSSFLALGGKKVVCVNELQPPGHWVDILGAKDAMTYSKHHHIKQWTFYSHLVCTFLSPAWKPYVTRAIYSIYDKYLQVTHLLQLTHFIMILLYILFSWSFTSKIA